MTNEIPIVDQLRALLGPQGFFQGADECAAYETGARYGNGKARAVLRPSTVVQAQRLLDMLSFHQCDFVIQGANTGLVGGSTPNPHGIQFLVSLDRMKTNLHIDPTERIAFVDAGVRLSDLNRAAAEHDLFFPIDLSADPSIGGMISTNTGGAQLIRYGDVRANLCSVDIWLPGRGDTIRLGSSLRKDNTGVDLKQLLCGTSGAMGVVLSACVRLSVLPLQRATALLVPAKDTSAIEAFQALERYVGDFLASAEVMSRNAMHAVLKHIPGIQNPFGGNHLPASALLVELHTTVPPRQFSLEGALIDALGELSERGIVSDALLGDSANLWKFRHSISEALRHEGRVVAFDLAFSMQNWKLFHCWAENWIAQAYSGLIICDFGHIADGGVHFNVVIPWEFDRFSDDDIQTLRTHVLDAAVGRFAGSFSAEHGIGPYNLDFYQRYTDPRVKSLSADLQHLFMGGRLGVVDFS